MGNCLRGSKSPPSSSSPQQRQQNAEQPKQIKTPTPEQTPVHDIAQINLNIQNAQEPSKVEEVNIEQPVCGIGFIDDIEPKIPVGRINKSDPRVIQLLQYADEFVLNASSDSSDWNLQSLADYISTGIQQDYTIFEKELFCTRSLLMWIFNNIEYDINGVKDGSYHRRSLYAMDVMKARKTIYSGLVTLYINVLDRLDIECKDIKGWIFNISDELPEEPNHEWNAVKIDNKWVCGK
jgi:transglutaminase/protease-like cytokinesis protein 3